MLVGSQFTYLPHLNPMYTTHPLDYLLTHQINLGNNAMVICVSHSIRAIICNRQHGLWLVVVVVVVFILFCFPHSLNTKTLCVNYSSTNFLTSSFLSFPSLFLLLRQCLAMASRLTWNSWSPCLHLPSSSLTDVHHCALFRHNFSC